MFRSFLPKAILCTVCCLTLTSCGPSAVTLAERYVDALEAGRIEQANEIRNRVATHDDRFQDEFLSTVEESLSSNY